MAWRLFVPLGQLQGNFSVAFYHAKLGGKGKPPPQQVQGIESTVGGPSGRSPRTILKWGQETTLFTGVLVYNVKKNSSSLETYEKEKLARCVYMNLGKLKLQMNKQIFCHVQGSILKRWTRVFSRNFKFTNIVKHSDDLHEIDKRSNMKLKRLPKILFFLLY